MNAIVKIGVIGFNTFEEAGIRSFLFEHDGVRAEGFGGIAEFLPLADRFDAFIVASDLFVEALDFFLPRKTRTIVISPRIIVSPQKDGLISLYAGEDESEVRGMIHKFMASLQGDEQPGELSQREIEVLRLIAKGMINKEIADVLCISVNTVITHRKNITTKLGVKSASGLSLYAIMNGLI